MPVLYRAHPTEQLLDALVVVPVDVLVDQDEHLVAGSEHGLDPAVPVPALGSGERPGHPDTQPGVSVNGEPGVVAVGGRPVRCRASMSSS